MMASLNFFAKTFRRDGSTPGLEAQLPRPENKMTTEQVIAAQVHSSRNQATGRCQERPVARSWPFRGHSVQLIRSPRHSCGIHLLKAEVRKSGPTGQTKARRAGHGLPH